MYVIDEIKGDGDWVYVYWDPLTMTPNNRANQGGVEHG